MSERIVIDTNVLLSALQSRHGGSYALLEKVGTGKFETAVSVPLVLEYEAVLTREHLAVDQLAIDAVLDYICAVSSKRSVFYLWRPLLKDIKDDHVLELAVEAGCTSIITFNKRDFSEAGRFGMILETPSEFLRRLELI